MITLHTRTPKGPVTLHVPNQLDEISFSQLMALETLEADDYPRILHLLSGHALAETPLYFLTPAHIITLNQALAQINQQATQLGTEGTPPRQLVFTLPCGRKRIIKPGYDPGREPTGAFANAATLLHEQLTKNPEGIGGTIPLGIIAEIMAHYFYCPATGLGYDEERAEDLKPGVENLSAALLLQCAKPYLEKLTEMIKTERQLLGGKASEMEVRAGIQGFEPFGYLNSISAIAKKQGISWPQAMTMPYNLSLSTLLLLKQEGRYEKAYYGLLNSR